MIPEGEKYSELVQEVEEEIKRYYSNLPLKKDNREDLNRVLDFSIGLTQYQSKFVVLLDEVDE